MSKYWASSEHELFLQQLTKHQQLTPMLLHGNSRLLFLLVFLAVFLTLLRLPVLHALTWLAQAMNPMQRRLFFKRQAEESKEDQESPKTLKMKKMLQGATPHATPLRCESHGLCCRDQFED